VAEQIIISVSVNTKQHKELIAHIEFLMKNNEISKAKACRLLMLKGLEQLMAGKPGVDAITRSSQREMI